MVIKAETEDDAKNYFKKELIDSLSDEDVQDALHEYRGSALVSVCSELTEEIIHEA